MRQRFRRTLAAAVCLIVIPVSGALGGEPRHDLTGCPKRSADSVEFRKDDWVKISPPDFSRDRVIKAFSASPGFIETLYASNGEQIKITRDGGCTWSTIYPLAAPGGAPVPIEPAPTLTHLAASPSRAMWAAGYQTYGAVDRPRVYWASDALVPEPAFPAVDLGLPTVGRVVDLQVPFTQETTTAYAVVEEPSTANPTTTVKKLYTTWVDTSNAVTTDLGVQWKNIPLPDGFGPLEGFRASSRVRDVWVWSGSQYAVTDDVLAEEPDWKTYQVKGEVVTVDVAPGYNGAVVNTIVVREQQNTQGKVAADDGKIVGDLSLPVAATAIAHGSRVGVYAVTDGKRTFGYDVPQRRWADITPRGGPAVPAFDRFVMAPSSSGMVVLGQTPDAVYRWDTYLGERFLPPPAAVGVGGSRYTLPRSDLTDVQLTPTKKVVTVKPGVLRNEVVELQVPPDANKIDVFFLLDTTNSMHKIITRLTESIEQIATDLQKAIGKEACFGLGEFKDNTADAIAKNQVYRRHMPIPRTNCQASLADLKKELGEIYQEGGGGDEGEAQTVALTQAVTGEGHRQLFIDKGQNAEFHTDSFKVIVLLTDDSFKRNGAYPTVDTTIETLNREHVKVVSVQALTNEEPDKTRADLVTLARGTNTFAPENGVDCDSDGKLGYGDLQPGEPLICETDGNVSIAPAILGLLLGVQDFGTIAVQVDDPQDVVQEPIKGATSALVNMKRASGFDFTLPLMCSKEQDGLDLPIGLLPTVRAHTVLDKAKKDVLFGEITVQCRGDVIEPPEPPKPPKPPDPPIDPPAKPRPPLAVAIQPPPQPPAQPISNINLNAGFSQQEEQQFQVATVTQGAQENEQEQEDVELAMTGLDPRRNDLVAGAAVLAGATMMSAAAAAAYRRRLQRSPSRAYIG